MFSLTKTSVYQAAALRAPIDGCYVHVESVKIRERVGGLKGGDGGAYGLVLGHGVAEV